jgi:hypothetical protein
MLALWESGSAVFGRTDQYSDIDLEALIAPGQLEAVVGLLRTALAAIAPISHEYRQQLSQGDTQFFWQLTGASPFNFVDLTLTAWQGQPLRLGAHGEGRPIVHFDKPGCLNIQEETASEMELRVRQRLREIAAIWEFHPRLVEKHIRRGHILAAYGQYQRLLIGPLIDLLRIKHCPQRSSWQTTYITWDLPVEIQKRLVPLVMVSSLGQMEANLPAIATWGRELIHELESGPLGHG